MRRKLLAGVSCAALALAASQAFSADPAAVSVAPAPPLPYINAVLSLWAGGVLLNSEDSEFDGSGLPTFGGDARIGGNQWILEIYGAWLGSTDDDATANSEAATYFLAAGHYIMRDPGGDNAYGIFAGLDAAGHMDTEDHSVNAFVGLEGAVHRGMQTYFGQFGGTFCMTGDCTDTWETGVFGRAGLRHFFNPDTKLEIDAVVAWGYFDSSDTTTFGYGWGAEFEQQVQGGPFSFFGAYRGTYTEEGSSCTSCSDDVTDHAFLLGVRVRTGGTDLYTDYKDGASIFNTPVHHFHRFRSFPDEL